MIEDKHSPQENWQTLYMEQYFSQDRTIRLCDVYEEPPNETSNFNLVFFMCELKKGRVLRTPCGSEIVTKLQKLPREYKKGLSFEKRD